MEVNGQPHFQVPRERALGTHWTGGRVGPGAGLDAMEKITNRTPAVQPVAIPTELFQLPLWRIIYKEIMYA
jgi:hypothetical protein